MKEEKINKLIEQSSKVFSTLEAIILLNAGSNSFFPSITSYTCCNSPKVKYSGIILNTISVYSSLFFNLSNPERITNG